MTTTPTSDERVHPASDFTSGYRAGLRRALVIRDQWASHWSESPSYRRVQATAQIEREAGIEDPLTFHRVNGRLAVLARRPGGDASDLVVSPEAFAGIADRGPADRTRESAETRTTAPTQPNPQKEDH